MNDGDALSVARSRLRAHLEALVGPGPILRFEEALTHASFANETGAHDNQRLEFLGDSVLGLCVSEMLVLAHPAADEALWSMPKLSRRGRAASTWVYASR
jgi:hypothetical protein